MADRRYEDKRLEFVFKRSGLTAIRKELVTRQERSTGDPFLTFSVFNDTFPTYPLRLSSSRLDGKELHKERTAALPRWFEHFRGLPFVAPFHAFLSSIGESSDLKPTGLVFPRKGFRQGLIIYNGDLNEYRIKGGEFVFETSLSDSRTMTYHVRPFSAVVEGIYNGGRGWKPTNLYEGGLPS
jgi:hypothetical protein